MMGASVVHTYVQEVPYLVHKGIEAVTVAYS